MRLTTANQEVFRTDHPQQEPPELLGCDRLHPSSTRAVASPASCLRSACCSRAARRHWNGEERSLQRFLLSISAIRHDPVVMGGKPCVRGLRITAGTNVGLIASGSRRERILQACAAWWMEEREEALVLS